MGTPCARLSCFAETPTLQKVVGKPLARIFTIHQKSYASNFTRRRKRLMFSSLQVMQISRIYPFESCSTIRLMRWPSALLGCAAILMISGCSTFNSDWKAAATKPMPTNDLGGRWEGSWFSEASGHKGSLRCLITRIDDRRYNARYRAKYKKIFSFEYIVPMTVTNSGSNFVFTGEANLGKLAGGVYSYSGVATGSDFDCAYKSKRDYGKFTMTRAQ